MRLMALALFSPKLHRGDRIFPRMMTSATEYVNMKHNFF